MNEHGLKMGENETRVGRAVIELLNALNSEQLTPEDVRDLLELSTAMHTLNIQYLLD